MLFLTAKILAHASEGIKLNNGFGLGELTEEGLEAQHKLIRHFKNILTQKTSLDESIMDVFNYLWARNDPIVRSRGRIYICSFCKKIGHTVRSCPLKKSSVLNEDDGFIIHFYSN